MRYLLVIIFIVPFRLSSMIAQSFPNDWEGRWSGIVEIWNLNEKVDEFPMSLEIMPKDTSWSYTITYEREADKPDVREYSLIVIQDSIGHYAIDEHNTIILDSYFSDNCLYAGFGGLGSALLSQICMEDEMLNYEIISAYSEPVRISGGTETTGDGVPEITSHQVYNVMKAKLLKE